MALASELLVLIAELLSEEATAYAEDVTVVDEVAS